MDKQTEADEGRQSPDARSPAAQGRCLQAGCRAGAVSLLHSLRWERETATGEFFGHTLCLMLLLLYLAIRLNANTLLNSSACGFVSNKPISIKNMSCFAIRFVLTAAAARYATSGFGILCEYI